MGRMVEHFSFAGLRAFDTQAVQVQKKNSNALSIFDHFGILDYVGTFPTTMEHLKLSWTILDRVIISDNFRPF